jgi:hypothetical protein
MQFSINTDKPKATTDKNSKGIKSDSSSKIKEKENNGNLTVWLENPLFDAIKGVTDNFKKLDQAAGKTQKYLFGFIKGLFNAKDSLADRNRYFIN